MQCSLGIERSWSDEGSPVLPSRTSGWRMPQLHELTLRRRSETDYHNRCCYRLRGPVVLGLCKFPPLQHERIRHQQIVLACRLHNVPILVSTWIVGFDSHALLELCPIWTGWVLDRSFDQKTYWYIET